VNARRTRLGCITPSQPMAAGCVTLANVLDASLEPDTPTTEV